MHFGENVLTNCFRNCARSLAVFATLLLMCCGSPAAAQTNPCDLNHDGIVNFGDVIAAAEMMRGQLQCTADILGQKVCNLQVVYAIGAATSTGVCVTGTPLPPGINGFSLTSAALVPGASGQGTVSLNGSAGPGGVLVALSASDTAVQVPASVTIPEGATSATFQLVAGNVTVSDSVTLTAYAAGVWATADVTVAPVGPITIASFACNPALLVAGQSATGTITLNAIAPAGGAQVSLFSSNPLVTVPASITIPAGSDSFSFLLGTSSLTAPAQVLVTASYGGVNTSLSIPIVTSSVTLTWTASTSPGIAGYNMYRGTVTGGPYTLLNATPASVTGTTYNDRPLPGQTYYYVTTAVDTSGDESGFSNEATAVVPN